MADEITRTFPLEECLAPFPEGEPVGEDVSLSGLYEELREYARADDPLLAGGEEYRPKGGWKESEWDKVEAAAIECLRGRSKDLRVARFLAQALGERYGLAGMRDGLALLRELQERYWDSLHPVPDRVRHPGTGEKTLDPEPRALEVDLVVEHFTQLLAGRPPVEGADAEAVDRADELLEEIAALRDLAEQRYFNHDSDGKLARLARTVEEHVDQARREVERRREAERRRREAEEARRRAIEDQAREEERRREEQARVLEELMDGSAGAPAGGPGTLLAQVAAVARNLRAAAPSWSAGYLLPLVAAWGENYPGAGGEGAADTAALAAARAKLEELARARAWREVVEVALDAVLQPWGMDWLDPARFLVQAAEEGGIGIPAEGVETLVRWRLAREPDWPRRRLADGEQAAEPATQGWLLRVAEKAAGEAPPEEPAPAGAEPAPGPAAEPGGAPPDGLPPGLLEEATALFQQGSLEDAIALLEQEVNAAGCQRTRFLRSLDLAEWLLENGQAPLAAALFSWMMDEIENRSLEGWEDAAFLRRVYQGALRALPPSDPYGDAEEKRRRARAALCLVAPSWAVRFTS